MIVLLLIFSDVDITVVIISNFVAFCFVLFFALSICSIVALSISTIGFVAFFLLFWSLNHLSICSLINILILKPPGLQP